MNLQEALSVSKSTKLHGQYSNMVITFNGRDFYPVAVNSLVFEDDLIEQLKPEPTEKDWWAQ